MQKLFILSLLFLFAAINAQYREYTFSFNPSKFIKQNKIGMDVNKKDIVFPLYDINGEKVKFITQDITQQTMRKNGIYTFDGLSEDQKKKIRITLTKTSLTASILQGTQTSYIEKKESNCNKKYIIYQGTKSENLHKQPNDFIK